MTASGPLHFLEGAFFCRLSAVTREERLSPIRRAVCAVLGRKRSRICLKERREKRYEFAIKNPKCGAGGYPVAGRRSRLGLRWRGGAFRGPSRTVRRRAGVRLFGNIRFHWNRRNGPAHRGDAGRNYRRIIPQRQSGIGPGGYRGSGDGGRSTGSSGPTGSARPCRLGRSAGRSWPRRPDAAAERPGHPTRIGRNRQPQRRRLSADLLRALRRQPVH